MYSVVGADGAVYGPVDLATIRAWIGQGRVTPTTNLIEPLSGRVLLAGQCQDLTGAFPPSSPPVANRPSQGLTGPSYSPGPVAGPQSGYSGYHQPAPATNWYTLYAPAPYGVMVPASPRSKVVAILLAFFLWPLGIHRFYLGYNGLGVLALLCNLFLWWMCYLPWLVFGVLALIDIVMIATGGLRDAEGRPLTN